MQFALWRLTFGLAVVDPTYALDTVHIARLVLQLDIQTETYGTACPASRFQSIQKQFCLLGRLGLVNEYSDH